MAILPIALTLYLIYWLASTAESVLGAGIEFLLQRINVEYMTGMGIAAGVLLTLGIGLLLKFWIFRKLFSLGEKLLEQIPGIKSIYGSVRDLVGFFDASKEKGFDKTVMVTIGDDQTSLMGLVTRDDFSDLPKGIGDDETVAVYLPMSYQLGGFTVMVPKSKVRPVDMKVDQAMQFVLTAGVSTEHKDSPAS